MTRHRRARAELLAAGVALAVAACGPRGVAAPGEAEYVGGARCAGCHRDEAALWRGSHHDLAMQPATAGTVLGDFGGATFTHRGVTSTFLRREGRYVVRTEGADGALADHEVAFTFGVEPLQQYLVAFPGGRYQALEIAWDARPAAEGGQRWYHLYPDADTGPAGPLHWTRPSQTWNGVCAGCHSTNLIKGFDPETGAYATTWTDVDVSCEACHGPGSTHVAIAGRAERTGRAPEGGAWGLANPLPGDAPGWTIAPGAMVARRDAPPTSGVEIDTCAPCHARRATIATGHAPGAPMLASYAPSLLRAGLYHADGQISDEVYVYGSFLQSRMYRAGVTCSDCHDPHALRLRADGNDLCTRCHLAGAYDDPAHTLHAAGSPGARCVECHMPATTYMGVDARRDHGLRVPRPDLGAEVGVPDACSRCHVDRPPEWAARALADRGRSPGAEDRDGRYARAIAAGRLGDPSAVDELVRIGGDPAVPAIRRGTALSLLAGQAPARITSAIRAGLDDDEPLVRIGALQALDAFPPASVLVLASPLVDDTVGAVRAEAARLVALRAAAPRSATQASARERAEAEYARVQHANADHSGAWLALGDLAAASGRPDDAERAYRKALELDATDWGARLDLADLQRALGRDDLALETLESALRVAPEQPELLHAMGLLRVRQDRREEALAWLGRAAAGRPDDVRFAYVYGVALWSAGDRARSRGVLEDALARRPFDRDVLAALATYARELGDMDAARAYARRLVEIVPDDPRAADLLRTSGG